MRDIVGWKGQSSGGSSGTESPDSLHSTAHAKVLDLVSEGEILGLVAGLQSVYLDGTPIQNPDGSENFSGYSIDWRWGTQDQTYLSGFPSVENEHSVGVELKDTQPWTQAITDLSLSAVRILMAVPQLQQSNASTGDITGYRIEYAIDLSTDGAAFQQVLTGAFDGKTTSQYERSIRIELPGAALGWTLRVRRTTANANSSLIADTVNLVSYTEIVDAKLRYPMSAVIGLQIDASQFQSVPTRSFDLYGRIIKVPTNYDPVLRTYSGAWDGTFKLAWSNNPAWVFYDLVLNDRYGLGQRVNAAQIDKWGLYSIAQYCDVMVSDGKGAQEPRFTCNVYIQSTADAYQVLQDLAGIFRGMAYWANSQVFAVADMPGDSVYTYTAANVVGGQFKYVGSPRTKRFTVALVSWNDPSDQYKQKVEYVADDAGIARYGVQQTSISAFGCTSQGQAQRVGQWALLTSRLETETVTFQVGLDATIVSPGKVFKVADPNRAGRRNSGRIRAVSGRTVTLDKAPIVNVGDTLTIILPAGTAEKHTVQSVEGNDVTVVDNFSTAPVLQSIWLIESDDLVAQTFRCLSVAEQDGIVFEITATQHEPGKFDAIDNGTRIDPRPITVIPPSVQPPPANVRLATYNIIDQGIARTVMTIAWDAAANGVAYQAQWRKDNGEWVSVPQTGSLSVDVIGIYQGEYLAAVRAVNAMGVVSIPAYSEQTPLQGKTSPPPAVTFLRTTSQIFGIGLDWGFPDGAGDTERTEIWYSKTADRDDAQKFSDFAYPQATTIYQGLAAGQSFFFWARLIDRSGNIGPWYPDGAGVNGQSSSDATPLLAYLTGEITKTQLGEDVLDPINAIPGLQQDVQETAAAITDEQQARVDGDAALSSRLDQVSAQVVIPPMAGSEKDYAGSTTVYAGVWSEQSARAEADLALAQNNETTTAQISSTKATMLAAVQTETQARVDAVSALTTQVTTVQAQADDNTAAVQTVAQSYANLNGQLSASYTIKTQITSNGRTYIAGIGIGIDNNNGVVESQVLVAAQRFAILDNTGSTVSSPFIVQGGQVFLAQAFIGTGWIQNAMIGDVIQSTAVGANGQPRWKLDKNGTLTLNGANGGSGYMTLTDSTLLVYDNNNVLRVRLGLW
ncbi:host specificity protein J [Paraburkholderia tropica]|uniref:host specificity protein J n=1 Tax=Paraburkholderia tropica TaxID=92647 RepID=UPI0015FF5F99|nr:host specificity protein J [Paraburkholderia tropica]QNB10830.1 host specificity protein J [Paraburkholderia tropica]